MKSRFLVGVLHSGEPQYDRCIEAIRSQTGVEFDIETIANLPNKRAHNRLYSTFMRRSSEFDFMVKVDADMVILRATLFSEISTVFEDRPGLMMVTVPVWDYFTDQSIIGLHAYRDSVRWPASEERVFVDDPPVPVEEREEFPDLGPAAEHCSDPSHFQSFYFGVHKGLKVRAALADLPRREGQLVYHWENIERVWQHSRRNDDPRLLIAALGGELAIAGEFETSDLDRDSDRAKSSARTLEGISQADLLRRVHTLRRRNRLGLSSASRLEILRDGFPRFLVRRILPSRARTAARSLLNAMRGR
jgi:hypothetical protein